MGRGRSLQAVLDFLIGVLVAGLFAVHVGAAAGAARDPAAVDAQRMRQADQEPGNWMSWGRTYDEQRFSPLEQINDRNVGRLGLAWHYDLHTMRGVEATPLVVDGVMYDISAWDVTVALDAATGKMLWTYDPKVPPAWGRYACCGVVSRGLAAWQGKVYIGTLDGRLIALDATTGKPVWTVQTFDQSHPYSITGAVRVFDGKVVVGNGGADLGVRGFVTAYDARTGKKLWRFYIVPHDPQHGPQESKALQDIALPTWDPHSDWELGGGGTAWDSIVYDPQLDLIYIGTGNGGPLAQHYRSPKGGDNLFLASIVAVNADTGKYVWHYQEAPGEEWDFTATQPMMLADLRIGGRVRKVLMQAPKDGFFYVLDRETGQLISAKNYVPDTWASGVDLKTGRPLINPAARYGTTPVLVTPGSGGGHNWNPMSYSPLTGLVYIPVTEQWMPYALDPGFTPKPFRSNSGWAFSGGDPQLRKKLQDYADAHEKAWLSAWDPVHQREVWRVDRAALGNGGTLATAGNLVVEGTVSKTLAIYRATDGRKLWEMPVQNVPLAGPISYTVNGEQYIAVNAGWGGGRALVELAQGHPAMHVSQARILAFRLGGTDHLPPLPKAAAIPRPPPLRASEAEVKRGGQLYQRTCAICHGNNAVGGVKDLRHMSAATHKRFAAIVLGGLDVRKGMGSFADVLDNADVAAIHAYLISRANEDWGRDVGGQGGAKSRH